MSRDRHLNTLLNSIEYRLDSMQRRSNSCQTRQFKFGQKAAENILSPVLDSSEKNINYDYLSSAQNNRNYFYNNLSPQSNKRTNTYIITSPSSLHSNHLNDASNGQGDDLGNYSNIANFIHKQIENELSPIIQTMKKDVKTIVENVKKDLNEMLYEKQEEMAKMQNDIIQIKMELDQNKKNIEEKTNKTIELLQTETKKYDEIYNDRLNNQMNDKCSKKDLKELQEDLLKIKLDLIESLKTLESKNNQTFEYLQTESKKQIESLKVQNSDKLLKLNDKLMNIINEKEALSNRKFYEQNNCINTTNKNIEIELNNAKLRMENIEEKSNNAINKLNETLLQNIGERDKELQKLNSIYLDLVKTNSDYQSTNMISLNKLKSELDTLAKTNEVIMNSKLNNLSREISQNYMTNQTYEVSKKILLDDIEQVNKRIANFSFASKEDIEHIKNEQNSLFDNVQKMGENLNKKIINLNASNINDPNNQLKNERESKALMNKSYAPPPNYPDILFKMELFEELLNDHQKVLSSQNEKFAEKKDIKFLTEDCIKKSKFVKDHNDIKKKIEKINANVDDIQKISIPKLYEYIDEKILFKDK